MRRFAVEPVGTELGDMFLVADADGRLCAADFSDCEPRMRKLLARRFGAIDLMAGSVPDEIKVSLAAYFAGKLDAIEHIHVRLAGTAFQDEVWSALRTVEPGRPLAYSAFAARIGRPQSPRAVGHANSANPISIVVPCHRLVGVNGALTGYAGGIERKRWLLDHEARWAGVTESTIASAS